MSHHLQEIKNLIDTINENHKHHLDGLTQEVLIKVSLPDSKIVYVLIDSDGLELVNPDKENTVKNQVILTYKDLKKLIDNPINILRFVATGRVKIKGSIKEIINILEKI
jgi:putative sterol carrier protein